MTARWAEGDGPDFVAADGTYWLHFPDRGEWTGFRPGGYGLRTMTDAEFDAAYRGSPAIGTPVWVWMRDDAAWTGATYNGTPSEFPNLRVARFAGGGLMTVPARYMRARTTEEPPEDSPGWGEEEES